MDWQGALSTHNLSEDHAAWDAAEMERIRTDHPSDPNVLVQMSEDDEDWRVKGICAFTRSIGDCQMKDKTAASLYNSYSSVKVTPRPGVKKPSGAAQGRSRALTLTGAELTLNEAELADAAGAAADSAEPTKPYIINGADFCSHSGLEDGFVIIGCDGVWDEMSSEEAVKIVGELIRKHAHDADANLADLFIERVLMKAVVRLQETDPDEEELTLEEMKARPQGKKDPSHRSCLHDDITVLILHFQTDLSMQVASKVNLTLSSDPAEMAKQLFAQIDVNGDGLLDAEEIAGLAMKLGKKLSEAELADAMKDMDGDGDGSVDVDEFAAWWKERGITSWDNVVAVELFAEVDENGDGQLDATEIAALMKRLGKAMSPGELEAAMGEMDSDGDGAVSSAEFEAWWAESGKKLVRATKSSKLRTGDGGALDSILANVRVLSQDEERRQSTAQIVRLTEAMDQKSTAQLKQLFDTLDADKNGELQWANPFALSALCWCSLRASLCRHTAGVRYQTDVACCGGMHAGTVDSGELKQLIGIVLVEDAVTDTTVATLFEEMDADGSGTVEWDEFLGYFGKEEEEEPPVFTNMSQMQSPQGSPMSRRRSPKKKGGGGCCGSPR